MSVSSSRRLNAVNREELSLPAVKIAVPMAAGMIAAFLIKEVAAIIVMLILIPVVIYLSVKRSGLRICALAALFGVCTMFMWINSIASPISDYAGERITTEIEITDVISVRSGDYLYIAHGKIGGKTANLALTSDGQLSEGQRVSAVIDLSEPNPARAAFNLSNGILLEGEIAEYTVISEGGRVVSRAVKSMRKALFDDLLSSCSGDARMLAQAMLIGEDGGLSASLEDNMRVCGASHYTAVSGTHFAVLAAVILGMMSDNRRTAKSAMSLAFAFFGVLFFGPTKSVLRASVMFVISGLAGLFKRSPDTLNSLCISVIVLTAFRPANILDVGFAMSVLGVFGAGVIGPRLAERLSAGIPERFRWVKVPVSVMTVSVSAVVCTSPISAAVFGGVSALGALVTVIIAPLMAAAMTSMLIAGVTGLRIFVVPVEWAMRVAAVVVRFFGRMRAMYINMDFNGSWIFPLICAVLITVAAFGGIKLLKPMLRISAVTAALSLILSQIVILSRHEIRFTGNSVTSAAIVMRGRSAAVYISGGGGGLADEISQCFREHGIVKVECVTAPDADYIGALGIRELSDMADIDAVFANELTAKLLPELPVSESAGDTLSTDGITIGSAAISDTAPNADIVLFRGTALNPPSNSAQLAVYFLPYEAAIPGNGVNIRADRDFAVDLCEFID